MKSRQAQVANRLFIFVSTSFLCIGVCLVSNRQECGNDHENYRTAIAIGIDV